MLAGLFLLTLLFVGAALFAQDCVPAFPGAVGFGACAAGGRGGDVYHVTSLLDVDLPEGRPGTLRHAITSASGPRTIVFEVGGTIELAAALDFTSDRMTVAGQTAPGEGITVAGYASSVRASDVVIRYMRFRCGDFHAQFPGGEDGIGIPGVGQGNADLIGNNADALRTHSADRVVFDHVSASWSMDETLSVTVSRNITVQHSIISESLHRSFHHTGDHGLGSLVRGEVTPQDRLDGVGGYSFVGNLWAHHTGRNPGVGGQQTLEPGQTEDERRGCDITVANNVVYNWGTQSGHTVGGTNVRMNYIGNYLVAGPSTRGSFGVAMAERSEGRFSIYHEGNLMDLDRDPEHDGEPAGDAAFPSFEDDERRQEPFAFPAVAAQPAEAAYEQVLAGAGASLARDGIDKRIVAEVRARAGRIIDSQDEVGGLVPIAGGEPRLDADRDGMADEFEAAMGLDSSNPADGGGTDLHPIYTNLEVYLNSLVPTPLIPPQAVFTVDADVAVLGSEIVFDGSGSSAAEGRVINSFEWDFGDGTEGIGEVVRHTFRAAGTFTVKLTVRDEDGFLATTFERVAVELPSGDVAPWIAEDIGSPAVSGSAVFDGESLLLLAGGRGFSTVADAFHSVHQPVSGDGVLQAVVDVVQPSSGQRAVAGIAFRAATGAGSVHGSFLIESMGPGEHAFRFVFRKSRLTRSVTVDARTERHLRLVREAGTIAAQYSPDGADWTELARESFSSLPDTVLAGAVAAALDEEDSGTTAFARFSRLSFEPAPSTTFVRGDANADGALDLSDGVRILEYLFLGASAPTCLAAADANADQTINVTDAVVVLVSLFSEAQDAGELGACVAHSDLSCEQPESCEL